MPIVRDREYLPANNDNDQGSAMVRMPSRAGGRGALAIAVLLVAGCGSRDVTEHSVAPAAAATAPSSSTAPDPKSGSAMQIFLDPVTGQPREPTPEELAGLARREAAAPGNAKPAVAPSASPAPSQEFRLPDGTVGMRLPENASQPLMACRRLDGQVDEHCHLPPLPVPAPGPTSAPARVPSAAAGGAAK
ncbi:MAG: hypothetical protein MUF07_19465 [Steroidobacteraceae bacterium]|nr:hypothetical protein [Steroidobacteraceae bacterium]